MPLFEYECTRCSEKSEHLYDNYASRDILLKCEVCGGDSRFVVSAPMFRMQGQTRMDSPEQVFEGQPTQLAEGAKKYKRDRLKKGRRISVGDR